MEKVAIIKICEKVLERLSIMTYEKFDDKRIVNKSISLDLNRQLIFPLKIQGKELNQVDRISEQELRQLFIEEFKITHPDLFYSIETPTANKYSFTNTPKEINVGDDSNNGKSASLDMCIFKREKERYNRILNIEFKHQNAALKNLKKDVLKLMYEEQSGVFVFLLKNTNSGTLYNTGKTGVLNKLCDSFSIFKDSNRWRGDEDKTIQLIILSLEQNRNGKGTPTLISRTIREKDLNNPENLLSINKNNNGDITTVNKESGWEMKSLSEELGIVAEYELKKEKG